MRRLVNQVASRFSHEGFRDFALKKRQIPARILWLSRVDCGLLPVIS
jgi:hypothetical protein